VAASVAGRAWSVIFRTQLLTIQQGVQAGIAIATNIAIGW
jgi:hypothetical protein